MLKRTPAFLAVVLAVTAALPAAAAQKARPAAARPSAGTAVPNWEGVWVRIGGATDPDTPITIAAKRRPDGIDLSVTDQGPGLPPGKEAKIFETFTRLEGSDRKGGTGLGLAIVKGFAEAMGLAVSAATRDEPRGAVFTIHFPDPVLIKAREAE